MKVRALTIDEQKKFLEAAEQSSNFNQYAFILQTGLRTGELIGLKWSDIDWEKRVIHIQRGRKNRKCLKNCVLICVVKI
ncbi:MAG: tyrosine-type recombinase/integrase [Lachnospiraceae bacterium]|nr:tyrosine-type recombinase/integrase [Lachnospiraceae bacterium]